ncbi:MAG: nitronate monooxygenase [Burkholderiaceae bacterium]
MSKATLHTAICDRFGIEVPIFGFSHSVETVAAVCNAGGFGVYGATRRLPDEIRDELAQIRALVGKRPFGVDLVIPAVIPAENNREQMEAQIPERHRSFVAGLATKYEVPEPSGPGMRTRFVRSQEVTALQVKAVVESDVDLVALGVGCPADVVAQVKASGKTTLALVGQEKHARKALQAGADILVAQGTDAGGHTGGIGTFSLVPRIVALAGDTPVLAAGGVATGEHIAAALMLGCRGWAGHGIPADRGKRLAPDRERDPQPGPGQCRGCGDQSRREWKTFARPARPGPRNGPPPMRRSRWGIRCTTSWSAISWCDGEHDVKALAHSGAGQESAGSTRLVRRPT